MMKHVAQYDPVTGEELAVFQSMTAAADTIPGAHPSGISRACKGKLDISYGYRWSYYRTPSVWRREASYGNIAKKCEMEKRHGLKYNT